MKKLIVKLVGIVPLLMHNGQMRDPLNIYAEKLKKLTSKRTKTEADYAAIKEIELEASLYLNSQKQVIVPDVNIEACILAGAKKFRKGKDFQAGLMVEDHAILVDSNGKVYTKEMVMSSLKLSHDQATGMCYSDSRIALVQGKAIVRTRAIFPDWKLQFNVIFNPEILDTEDIIQAIGKGGQISGLGTWRPKFGRYLVEEITEVEYEQAKTA